MLILGLDNAGKVRHSKERLIWSVEMTAMIVDDPVSDHHGLCGRIGTDSWLESRNIRLQGRPIRIDRYWRADSVKIKLVAVFHGDFSHYPGHRFE